MKYFAIAILSILATCLLIWYVFPPNPVDENAPVNNDSLYKKIDSLTGVTKLLEMVIEESSQREQKYIENERRYWQMIKERNEKIERYTKSDIDIWLDVYARSNRYGVHRDSSHEIAD